jgi:diphosphate-dependent phosphofructokinase
LSSGKYYNFVRLMGRAASNITLECALQTHPTITLLGEEVAARKQNMASITEEIVSVIVERAAAGKNYGVILVPEGLIEFVPEISSLLHELNDLLAHGTEATPTAVVAALSAKNSALFTYLPASIKKQLLAERDPHGNVQVSLIETEKLLAELVEAELNRLRKAGKYVGTFAAQTFFLGYEGRCGLPSDFDTAYCYALGSTAAALLAAGETGVMSSVSNLGAPVEQWSCGGVPLTVMMNMERRHGKDKPVIRKWLVDLAGAPFRVFAESRARWAHSDCFRCPGPIQLDTSNKKSALTRVDPLSFTLKYELEERERIAKGGANPVTFAGSAGNGYAALLEGLLSTGGLEGLKPIDMTRIAVYRAAHGISDDEHASVLEAKKISLASWKHTELLLAKAAAATA